MTQEEKSLLLQDLCARLPYGINVKVEGERYFDEVKEPYIKEIHPGDYLFEEDDITIIPYLRPMSSMTEEEKKELKADTCPEGTGYFDEKYLICPINHYGERISYDFMSVILEWLNERHFDYRGLIPMGLALEAPKNMYK